MTKKQLEKLLDDVLECAMPFAVFARELHTRHKDALRSFPVAQAGNSVLTFGAFKNLQDAVGSAYCEKLLDGKYKMKKNRKKKKRATAASDSFVQWVGRQ